MAVFARLALVSLLVIGCGPDPAPGLAESTEAFLLADRSSCVDYRPGYWLDSGLETAGVPMDGRPGIEETERRTFTALPPTISACELEQLQKDCVDRLNQYRSGALRFEDGSEDPAVVAGLSPLTQETGNHRCHAAAVMGALALNVEGGGGCAGAHANAFECPWRRRAAQNSCCAQGDGASGVADHRRFLDYVSVRSELFACLDTMWNEGIRTGAQGHWKAMRSPKYTQVSCAFAWTEQGRVMMTQNFSQRTSVTPCSCDGLSPGSGDGCGGTCVPNGQWYCRKPGRHRGPFRRAHCALDCEGSVKRQARCCVASAGGRCSRSEKQDARWCPSVKPTCVGG